MVGPRVLQKPNAARRVGLDPADWRPGTPVVGQAWETDEDDGVREVTVAVGIDDPTLVGERLIGYRDRIDGLAAENEQLRERLGTIEGHLGLDPASEHSIPADD